MTVSKDLSFVADSTCSPSSPSPTNSSPILHRLSVHFPKMSDDTDVDPPSSSVSRDRTYRTGPPDLDEQVPPSSDLPHSENELADDENEDSPQGTPRHDFFGLRKQMAKVDEMDDSELKSLTISGLLNASPSERSSAIPSHLEREQSPHVPTSSTVHLSDPLTRDQSTLDVSPLIQNAFSNGPSPFTPQVTQARRRLKKRVVHGSDFEDELGDNKGSSATKSPAFPHAVNTPKSRSSPTPPTSDDDDLPAHPMHGYKPRSKGRIDSSASRATVVPLQFSEDPDGSSVVSKKSAQKDKRNKKSKIKPPTKKELKETRRESARLAADQQVSIPRSEENVQKYTFQSLFATVKAAGRPIGKEPSSDPIADFSSPLKDVLPLSNQHVGRPSPMLLETSLAKEQPGTSKLRPIASLRDINDSDSDALPEVGELVSEEQRKRDKAQVQKALLQKKKLLLAQQATKPTSSDDDDLEIVPARETLTAVKAEEAERMSRKKQRISEGRKRQLNLGGIVPGRQRAKETPSKDGASPFVISSIGKSKRNHDAMSQSELNRTLVQMVKSKNKESTTQKEAEWERRGGKVVDAAEGAMCSANDATASYAEKGLLVAEQREVTMEVDEDEDEGSDYETSSEMRGSASPSPQPYDTEERDEDNEVTEEDQEADVTMVNPESEDLAIDDDLDEKQALKARSRRRAQAIIDSDSDGNDENSFSMPKLRMFGSPQGYSNENAVVSIPVLSMAHRGSLSSTDERTEDENDKENNTSLMFDRSEDKENKAVVRHGDAGAKHPLGTRIDSPDLEMARCFSMSPVLQSHSIGADDGNNNADARKPFKDLLDDDPFASPVVPSKVPTSFATRLQQVSPPATLPLVADFEKNSSSPQSPQVSDVFGGELLQPGFSDLFESGTEIQKSTPYKQPAGGLGLSKSFLDEPDPTLNKLRKPGHSALDLTQDVVLQPAFQIGSGLLRKADQIFEKEQGYLLEAANKKLQKEPTLYVNDHGFLTQNRPEAASPRIYIPPSPSQASTLVNTLDPQSSARPPLRTLSLSQSVDSDSPNDRPFRRLRRAGSPSRMSDAGYRSISPSPQKPVRNAFDVLTGASKDQHMKAKRRLEKSDYIEFEAQESDDEDSFGFMGRRKDNEEEEDGEDQDKTLETLVDDREMDPDAMNADLVQEKYQEHAEQDDLEIEKLHQAAIQGELRRKKRHHGVGMDDSDDESDEDERNRRIRRGMHKKPKIDRDNIKDLANLEETKPFYNVYEHSLVDEELSFLAQPQHYSQDVVMGDNDPRENDEPPEITTTEVRRLARQLAEQPEVEEPVDLRDVSWIDSDASDGEGGVRVKAVDGHRRKQAQPRRSGIEPDPSFVDSLAGNLPKENLDRLQSWAKGEGRSRNAGTTGRSVGGAAVTGLRNAKVKSGGGSLRNSSTASADSSRTSEQRRPVKAMPSVLAGVAADRSARFG